MSITHENHTGWEIEIDECSAAARPNTDWHGSLMIDPEKKRIFTYWQHGNGTPAPFWNGQWKCVSIPSHQITAEALEHWVQSNLDALLAVASAYRGTHWDGSNHRGKWDDVADDLLWELDEDMKGAELEQYWSADEWFGTITSKEIAAGVAQHASFDAYVDHEILVADAKLDRDDVAQCLLERLEQAREE
jgi:hypothetical protein